jgi:hypothetical protein
MDNTQFTASALEHKRHYCTVCSRASVQASRLKHNAKRKLDDGRDAHLDAGLVKPAKRYRLRTGDSGWQDASSAAAEAAYHNLCLRFRRVHGINVRKQLNHDAVVCFADTTVDAILSHWNWRSVVSGAALTVAGRLSAFKTPHLAIFTYPPPRLLQAHDVVPIHASEQHLLRKCTTVEQRQALFGAESYNDIVTRLQELKPH